MNRVALLIALLVACRERVPDVSTTTWSVRITDGDGGPLTGARVLLFDAKRQPVHVGSIDLYDARQVKAFCSIGPGVIGSWDGFIVGDGTAEIPIGVDDCKPSPAVKYGRYAIWAWRGPEHELWEGEVDLSAGRGVVATTIALERVWRPPSALSADLHVHAARSNDSTVPDTARVLAQVAAGVQVIGLSDHNSVGDVDVAIAWLGLGDVVASIASNELSSDEIHVGVYPVPIDLTRPRGGSPTESDILGADVRGILAMAGSVPGNTVVQVNHPRFRVYSLYDSVGWNGVAWPPPFPLDFDAVEVLSGHTTFNVTGDRRVDDSLRDFYTMIDHGFLVTALGNSDTHHLNGVRDGLTRNLVDVDDARTQPFDEAGFVDAIRHRRVVATSGPLLDVEVRATRDAKTGVGPGEVLAARGEAWVDVTLYQARYVDTDVVRVLVGSATGPVVAHRLEPVRQRENRWTVPVTVGETDTWIGIDATGETPLPVEMTGTYQLEKKRPGVVPAALINPILVDADDDKRWKRGDADLPITDDRGVRGGRRLR
jgi:hypothetical protein